MVNTKIYTSLNNTNKIKSIFFNEDKLKKYYYLANTYDTPHDVIYIKLFDGKIISLYSLYDIEYNAEDNIGLDIAYTFGQAMGINRDSMIEKSLDVKKQNMIFIVVIRFIL